MYSQRPLLIRCFFISLFLTLLSPITAANPLPLEKAFQLEASLQDTTALQLSWKMPKGYFIYQDKTHINAPSNATYHLGRIQWPAPKAYLDKQGKKQSVYFNQLTLTIPVLGQSQGETTLQVQFQGCSEEGFCYPPQKRELRLNFNSQFELTQAQYIHPNTLTTNTATQPIPSLFQSHYLPFILLSFFGFGLLLAFTPCVLPMVPVLSGIILSQGQKVGSKKAFLLSLSYVLGLAFTYAFIGVGFALLGSNLQLIFQSIWMHGLLAFIFVLLALSMFDLYELRPPSHWQSWFEGLSKKKLGGPYWSSALLGSFSTLVLSPCVTPPLIGTLAYITQTGNVFLGGAALFSLGLGSGVPLLLISTSAAHYLPKAGHWMYGIKALFGLMLLALAIMLLSDFIPAVLTMALWGAFLLSTGVFIGALTPAYSAVEKAKQSLGLIALLFGTLILIGASMGNSNPLQPLASAYADISATKPHSTKTVDSINALQQAIQENKGQVILLDFYANWCTACKVMERSVFQDARFERASSEKGVIIKVDLTPNNQQTQALLKAYQLVAPPAFLFLDKQGDVIKSLTIHGETDAQTLLHSFDKAAKQ